MEAISVTREEIDKELLSIGATLEEVGKFLARCTNVPDAQYEVMQIAAALTRLDFVTKHLSEVI